ncbi:MAG: cephalosporin hydroxylase family protein [Acidobacteriota bacterium]|nr:cephalosporin hydroxylase family protein [Acidobacteriota bacterium]
MKIVIDTAAQTLTRQQESGETTVGLFTREAFEALSLEWLRVGWSLQHYHTFTWFGLPVLQLPEDLLRLQEVIYAVRPAVIVETGVFQGGSLLFHASLLAAMGQGRVIGIDREIQPPVREALCSHSLASRISLLEGSSTDPAIVSQVRTLIKDAGPVLVILDSDHTREHVERELECYAPLVTKGSYIVATDGIMKDLHDVPRAQPSWKNDNPFEAANAFAARHSEFRQQPPRWLSRSSPLTENITYWPGAWLERIT